MDGLALNGCCCCPPTDKCVTCDHEELELEGIVNGVTDCSEGVCNDCNDYNGTWALPYLSESSFNPTLKWCDYRTTIEDKCNTGESFPSDQYLELRITYHRVTQYECFTVLQAQIRSANPGGFPIKGLWYLTGNKRLWETYDPDYEQDAIEFLQSLYDPRLVGMLRCADIVNFVLKPIWQQDPANFGFGTPCEPFGTGTDEVGCDWRNSTFTLNVLDAS